MRVTIPCCCDNVAALLKINIEIASREINKIGSSLKCVGLKRNTLKKCRQSIEMFYPLEGFEGRVHGRCIQNHLGGQNTQTLMDRCCWVEHKNQCQLHNYIPENLKEKI